MGGSANGTHHARTGLLSLTSKLVAGAGVAPHSMLRSATCRRHPHERAAWGAASSKPAGSMPAARAVAGTACCARGCGSLRVHPRACCTSCSTLHWLQPRAAIVQQQANCNARTRVHSLLAQTRPDSSLLVLAMAEAEQASTSEQVCARQQQAASTRASACAFAHAAPARPALPVLPAATQQALHPAHACMHALRAHSMWTRGTCKAARTARLITTSWWSRCGCGQPPLTWVH